MTCLPSSSSLHLYITPPAAHPHPHGPGGGSSRGWCSWRRSPLWRWRCRWWWSWTGCRCRRSHGPGTSGHSSGQCGVPLQGGGRREEEEEREEMREDKRKHRGAAKRQKGAKDGEEKRRENVRFIARQLRSAFIIHSVLFCPRRPGKCGEKHTSSRLSEIFCLNSEACKMSDFWFKAKFTSAPAPISHLWATWHLWDRNKGEMAETLVTLTTQVHLRNRSALWEAGMFCHPATSHSQLQAPVVNNTAGNCWHHHYINVTLSDLLQNGRIVSGIIAAEERGRDAKKHIFTPHKGAFIGRKYSFSDIFDRIRKSDFFFCRPRGQNVH